MRRIVALALVTLAAGLACLPPAPAAAGEFREWLALTNGEHYQQSGYQPVDPKGDAFLVRKLDQVPGKLVRAVLRLEEYPQAQAEGPAGVPAATVKSRTDRLFALAGEKMPPAPEAISRTDLDRLVADSDREEGAFDRLEAKVRAGALDRMIREQEAALAPTPAPATPAARFGFRLDRAVGKGGAPEAFTIGRTHPFDTDRLINAFIRVIQAHPECPLTLTAEHAWSPEAKRYLYYGFWHRLGRFLTLRQREFPAPLFMRSKFFLLLACGWTARYAVTGNEAALEAKLLTYPERSLQIHQVFEASYVLNRGDLYLTLLCIENVLAGNPYDADRADKPLQKRLAYLRNDSAELGDNYGAWYHLFGIGLYGMLRPGLVSRAVAEIESFGSLFLEGRDKQEDYVNRLGAIFGLKLRRMLQDGSWKVPLPAGARTDYMTRDEFAR